MYYFEDENIFQNDMYQIGIWNASKLSLAWHSTDQ